MSEERAWVLPAAAGWLALENVGVLGALLFFRDTPPLVPVFLLLKFPACVGLLQRRHGAFMLLMLWETSTVVVALLNPALDWAPRLLLLWASVTGTVLLGRSIPLFPSVDLPKSD